MSRSTIVRTRPSISAHPPYVAIDNSSNTPFNLGAPANLTGWTGGSWSALDPATGAFLWQVPVAGNNLLFPQFGAGGSGAMTVANGVVFAPSLSGAMVALDAATGATLGVTPLAPQWSPVQRS
jgi:polyvinyl alcohol dehydrogenase (cytochrome)